MSKAEGKRLLTSARDAGRGYATEQIESEMFQDYVASGILAAEKDPDNHTLVRSKQGALSAARNFLTDLRHDTSRNLLVADVIDVTHDIPPSYGITENDIEDAFWEGFHEVLDRKTVHAWLADEILFRSREDSTEVDERISSERGMVLSDALQEAGYAVTAASTNLGYHLRVRGKRQDASLWVRDDGTVLVERESPAGAAQEMIESARVRKHVQLVDASERTFEPFKS
jgi:hypothetical protein